MGLISLEKYQDRIEDLVIQRKTMDVFHVFKKLKLSKEIYGLKKDLDDVYLNSIELNHLADSYQEVLNSIYSLFCMLEITNPIDIFVLYSYLVRKGYLSVDHLFVCSNDVTDSIPLLAVNVIEGAGVCRHIACLLTDIYKNFGYISANISMFLERYPSSFTKEDYSCDGAFSCTDTQNPYNHLVSLVKDRNGTLLFDALNDYIFFVWNHNNISPVFMPDIFVKCGYEKFFNSQIDRNFSYYLQNTNLDTVVNIRDCYNYRWDFCKKNQEYFDDFYLHNCDLYQDVTAKKRILSREFSRYIYQNND